MRQLHVLGVSEDGATLLLGTAKNAAKATHRLALDDRLRAAARGQLPTAGDRAESSLPPKEIQARLRAGATPEEVAKAAGVPVARVLPYFAPVEAERDRIVDEARGAVMHRHRAPDATRPLGELVDARLEETAGIKPETVTWNALRRPDGTWVVGVSYSARGGRRTAEWLWRPPARDLSPLDAAAARFGAEGAAVTKRRTAKAAKPAANKAAAGRPAAKKRPTAKSAATKTTGAKKANKTGTKKTGASKQPAATTKRAARPVPARKATTSRAVQKKAAVKTVAGSRATTTRLARPPAPRRRKPQAPVAPAARVEQAPPVVEVMPDVVPVATPAEPTPEQVVPAAAARRPGQRVPLPSWSDVLLGVTGSREETTGSNPPPAPRNGRRRAG